MLFGIDTEVLLGVVDRLAERVEEGIPLLLNVDVDPIIERELESTLLSELELNSEELRSVDILLLVSDFTDEREAEIVGLLVLLILDGLEEGKVDLETPEELAAELYLLLTVLIVEL